MSPRLAAKTVGVIGSGADEHAELAEAVGPLLARLGVNLLTGGGGGVMTSVSRVYTRSARAAGICIGIIPCAPGDPGKPRNGYPNPFVELPIYTHLPESGVDGTSALSRNHLNVLSSAALVALPGGAGTASEIELAERYGRPVILYAPDARLAAGLPAGPRRVATLREVEDFLIPLIPLL
jgi:uncharacterized protein (TIGR00725 family)